MPLRIPDALPLAAWGVVLDPSEIAVNRTALDINSDTITIDQTGIDWGDAAIQEYLADQQVGSSPVDYRLPNRQVTMTLSIGNADEVGYLAAKKALQQKVALIQREGGWLKRDTGIPLFADVVNATLTFPDHWGPTGFMENDVKLVLECLPDFYGTEVTLDLISGTGYVAQVLQQAGVQAVIAGDHPGRCRIIVTDTSGNNQSGLFWGYRSRYYDAAATAHLSYSAGGLTPLDAAAYDGTGNIQHNSLPGGSWCPVMLTDIPGVGPMTHAGTYRVKCRCWSNAAVPQLRFTWAVGGVSSRVVNDPVSLPTAGPAYIMDLGQIRIDRPPMGTHSWQGVLQAKAGVTGDTLGVARLWLVPLDESAGQISATQSASPFGIEAEAFSGAGGNDATIGTVTWTNPGNVTAASPQAVAVAGITSATTRYLTGTAFGFAIPSGAIIAGIKVEISRNASGATVKDAAVRLVKAGVVQAVDRADLATPWDSGWAIKAYGAETDLWGGTWTASDINNAGFGAALSAQSSGSAFAEVDWFKITIFYAESVGYVTAADAIMFNNQTVEMRTDGVWRGLLLGAGSGSTYAPVSTVQGDLPRIPPSGAEGRPVELLVKPSRGDLASLPDPAADGLTAQVIYRPSFLFPA